MAERPPKKDATVPMKPAPSKTIPMEAKARPAAAKTIPMEPLPPDEDELEEEEEEEDELAAEEEQEDEDDEEQDVEEPRHTARAHGSHGSPDPHHPPPHHKDGDPEWADQEPGWWISYLVLGLLVMIGVLGFFGFFAPLLPKRDNVEHATQSASAVTPAETAPAPVATPPRKTRPTSVPRPPKTAAPVVDADPTFGAKRIVIQYAGSKDAPATVTRTKDDAKKRATDALKKLRENAKFEDVAGEFSDEPGVKATGGNLGNFKRNVYDPSIQTVVEKTTVGQTSDVFESPYGYEIIQRTK